MQTDREVVEQSGLTVIIEMFLTISSKKIFTASSKEKKVVNAINKQKNEINKKEVDVKNLLDKIVAEIERECYAEPGRY